MPAAGDSKPQLAHMVYFALKERQPDRVRQLVDACRKYLSGHAGTVYFGVGTVNAQLCREVNIRDFDVALQLVFVDQAAHDAYQVSPRHQQFIAENKANWAGVRVFDADVN